MWRQELGVLSFNSAHTLYWTVGSVGGLRATETATESAPWYLEACVRLDVFVFIDFFPGLQRQYIALEVGGGLFVHILQLPDSTRTSRGR